ncbi:hypothetical protein EB796_024068 [Bugula neritina]|uniref:Uncharacterized protein n=1 Tax=Bugula neritina TaxID=10212 RepID=A0A7J7IVI4_BUGNE|nr:hypothetical protein EB796_024068 [Bugula neritina]
MFDIIIFVSILSVLLLSLSLFTINANTLSPWETIYGHCVKYNIYNKYSTWQINLCKKTILCCIQKSKNYVLKILAQSFHSD